MNYNHEDAVTIRTNGRKNDASVLCALKDVLEGKALIYDACTETPHHSLNSCEGITLKLADEPDMECDMMITFLPYLSDDRKIGTGVTAVVLLTVNFILSLYNLTTGIMWFVTALIGVAAVILISQFINENRILQYFGRISLIVLCIHGPVYRVVVKIISIPLHMGTDAVREKFLLAMLVMIVTMVICSLAYEIIVRVAPWMIGKKKVKVL